MNPRPKTFHTGVYILIPDFGFRRKRSPPNRIPFRLSCGFNRSRSRQPGSAVLLVDAPSGVAGISRGNGSCLSSYGVIIIVCNYV